MLKTERTFLLKKVTKAFFFKKDRFLRRFQRFIVLAIALSRSSKSPRFKMAKESS